MPEEWRPCFQVFQACASAYITTSGKKPYNRTTYTTHGVLIVVNAGGMASLFSCLSWVCTSAYTTSGRNPYCRTTCTTHVVVTEVAKGMAELSRFAWDPFPAYVAMEVKQAEEEPGLMSMAGLVYEWLPVGRHDRECDIVGSQHSMPYRSHQRLSERV
jgi:hypothetical protein